MVACRAEAEGAGGQVVVVGPVAAPLARAEAAVYALAAQDADVTRQACVHGLSASRECRSRRLGVVTDACMQMATGSIDKMKSLR